MTLEELKVTEEKKDWLKKCTNILLDSNNPNPFPKPPFATNYYNNPPNFCHGRDDYIYQISNEINDSINALQPKLIRIMGKQGIGKSTLICWCAQKLNEVYPTPIIYMETSGQPDDFNMRSLYRQITSKIEKTDFIDKLILNSIKTFVQTFADDKTLVKQLKNEFSDEEINNILKDPNYIEKKTHDVKFNEKLFELLTNNAIILKKSVPINLNYLLIFWKAHIQNPDVLDASNAFGGAGSFGGMNINTDNDASKYIDEIVELLRWSFEDKTTIIIIFDHLEAGVSQQKEEVFLNLFSLLLNLRQKKYMTLVLSGTLDAYVAFDEVLQEDQRLQLDNWAKTIALTNMNPNDIIEIVNRYLAKFWDIFDEKPSPRNSLFPFGINSIKYVYENHGQDLRKTLKQLYLLVEQYKKDKKVEYIDSFEKAFKIFRQRDDVLLSFIEKKELVAKLLDSRIKDTMRTEQVEKALCMFFDTLRDNSDYEFISDVKYKKSGGNKGPNIIIEFFGNESPDLARTFGIEVKISNNSKLISKEDIKKTYQILQDDSVDYINWITNTPLNLNITFEAPQGSKITIGRIDPLSDEELAYMSFMVYFKKLTGRTCQMEEIEFILNKIDLSPIKLKEKMMNLKALPSKTRDDQLGFRPIKSIEIGPELIRIEVEKFLKEKIDSNKKISYTSTIKSIRDALNLEPGDKRWNEDIWTITMDLTKDKCLKQTPKTIYF
ncbi:MAG: hypothetical protein JW891_08950 [Candidatus Lokiarchaeota archaeon]|nr:hypothetical protein [Candidatus Lokiarchaeota archaeon]